MDGNEYLTYWLTRQRLQDVQADARQRALAALAAEPRVPVRVALGTALIRIGRRLSEAPAEATTAVAC
jgi:hypothetical protein